MNPQVEGFFDPATWTVSYVVHAGPGSACAVIDPVLDFDPKSGRTSTHSAEKVAAFIEANQLRVEWLLETHAHADHMSAAPWFKARFGGRTAIGAHISVVQSVFAGVFNLEPGFRRDGSQFDHLMRDGESFHVGKISAVSLFVPGHTPACAAYLIGDALFVGDTLFMPDVGSARCDFPGGSAPVLYSSVRKLLSLAPQTRMFVCHDYPPAGRGPAWETTVAEQRARNIHLHEGISEQEFVRMRTARDATLDMPALILPSIQVNIRAGQMPPPETNGVSYLKLPLNAL